MKRDKDDPVYLFNTVGGLKKALAHFPDDMKFDPDDLPVVSALLKWDPIYDSEMERGVSYLAIESDGVYDVTREHLVACDADSMEFVADLILEEEEC